MIREIRQVLLRDLGALRTALRAYPTEETIWSVPPGIANSAGNLALHIVGNLQYYIGAQLGGTGYERDRTAEFSERDVPLSVIEHRIEATMRAVSDTLDRLSEPGSGDQYPIEIGGRTLTIRLFLTHLVSHTAYHLGQLDYHRRLINGVNRPAGPSIAGL
jgi:uncharacterized damage-inducible protein DinB